MHTNKDENVHRYEYRREKLKLFVKKSLNNVFLECEDDIARLHVCVCVTLYILERIERTK